MQWWFAQEAHQILENVGTPVGSMDLMVLLNPFFLFALTSVLVSMTREA